MATEGRSPAETDSRLLHNFMLPCCCRIFVLFSCFLSATHGRAAGGAHKDHKALLLCRYEDNYCYLDRDSGLSQTCCWNCQVSSFDLPGAGEEAASLRAVEPCFRISFRCCSGAANLLKHYTSFLYSRVG